MDRTRPPEAGADGRPVVALFRSPVFHAHETFVRAHAAGLSRYCAIVAGLEDRGHVPAALAGRVVLARGTAEQLAFKLGRVRAMAARLAPRRPALVHAHFAPDGLMALPLARALGVKLATSLHGYDLSRTRAALLRSGRLSWMRYALSGKRLREGGALFLPVSEALRQRALAAGFPPERTFTHYLGVDLARFRPRPGRAEPGLILHVGRLVEKKGTSLLIRALAGTVDQCPEARLVILGDGPLRLRLEAEAAALGVAGRVHFLGSRTEAEVADWMERAWLLAVPSLTARDGDSEGLPTVVVEAAAAALPVVGSSHSGIPEAVIDGGTGFLVPEGEAEPLARRIAELLRAPERRASMAAASRAMAEERFDGTRQIARLEAHYDRLLKEK